MYRQDADISEGEDSPPRFGNPQSHRDSSVASNISMFSEEDKFRYITAMQDEKGKNVKRVKGWHAEGKLHDYKIEGNKIKISFKNPANVQAARNVLGIKARDNKRGNRGGGKQGSGPNGDGLI